MIIEDENTSDFSVKVVGSQEEEATNQEEQQENQEESFEDNGSQEEQLSEEQNQQEQQNQEQKQQNEGSQQINIDEVLETLEDEKVLNLLTKKLGREITSLDELKPKEEKQLSETVKKFQQYVEETGNDNMEDFLQLQKDWTKEPQENVIKAFLKAENPFLDPEEIDFIYRKEYVIDEEDYPDEEEKMSKKIASKRDYNKGLQILEQQKEKYKVVKGFDENSIPEEFKKAKTFVDTLKTQSQKDEEVRNKFLQQTDSFFDETKFEGFKYKVGEKEVVVKADAKQIKNSLADLQNFDKKHFENGSVKDISEYYKSVYFAMNPDEMAKHFYELGKAEYIEEQERISKNIPAPGQKAPLANSNSQSIEVRVVK